MNDILISLALALVAQAPATDHAQMDHTAMQHAPTPAAAVATDLDPREPGQSAYAALGEVVRILMADPTTDWSKVNVDALRRHLVDMDNVTLRSTVATTQLPNGARFVVTGKPEIAQSIQRMTRMHFAEPDVGSGWKMKTEPRSDGAIITVTAEDPAQAAKITALGFFGILTMGAHHQPHHLMMARGAMNH